MILSIDTEEVIRKLYRLLYRFELKAGEAIIFFFFVYCVTWHIIVTLIGLNTRRKTEQEF